MGKTTDSSRKAKEIVVGLTPLVISGEKFLREYEIGENIELVRRNVYVHLRGAKVTVTTKGNKLFIGNRTRRTSREEQLEEMVKLLMLSVDDELLYDQARELVYGG